MLKFLFGLCLLIFTQSCSAETINKKVGYTVTPLSVNLKKPGDYADIVISNTHEYPLYFTHKFVKLEKLGDDREKRAPVNDYSLIASPNKLVVKPNSKEVVRISVIKPLSPGDSYGFLVSPLERRMVNKKKKNDMKMVLQCIIEYMVRIRTN